MVWPSVTLSATQLADLELMLLGAFGPVPAYPEQGERNGLRLPRLVVEPEQAKPLSVGDDVALRDSEGVLIAVLRLRGLDRPAEVSGVRLTGTVEGLRLPHHPDYPQLRLTPAQLRTELRRRGWLEPGRTPPWAVWADGLLHTADIGRIRTLARQGKRCVVLAPVGGADPADAHHHLRVRCLLAALAAVDAPVRPTEATLAAERLTSEATRGARPAAEPAGGRPPRSLLVLVPVVPAEVLTAPREPGLAATSPQGQLPGPVEGTAADAGLAELVALRAHLAEFYGLGGSLTGPALGAPSRAELSAPLATDGIPAELTPPAVAAELTRAYPPRHARGLTILFTGLSGSGKSTLAGLLVCRLLERGDRRVTLLDGDVVRTHLSKGLGFSRADRDTNIRRIGFVAAAVAGAGGTAVCAPIAPYAAVRAEVRSMVQRAGAGFVLVHVSTPLAVCEERDRKGLYAKARAGLLPAFTGVSDPYEDPTDADVVVDTSELSPDEAIEAVLHHLRQAGWLAP
jgi:sulfate adenylyltransferase